MSLIGRLVWSSQAYRGGNTFIRRLLFSLQGKPAHHHIQVQRLPALRADLRWWVHALACSDGSSILSRPNPPAPLEVFTDATPSHGGGFFGPHHFTCAWSDWAPPGDLPARAQITFFELLAVLTACATFGHLWRGHAVVSWCDNGGVVGILTSRSSPHPRLMNLVRRLHFLEIHFDFHLVCRHIPGERNIFADWLSRPLEKGPFSVPGFDVLGTSPRWDLVPQFDPFDLDLPGSVGRLPSLPPRPRAG
jgi:hypothetical protein